MPQTITSNKTAKPNVLDLYELIENRKSIRRFKPDAVPHQTVERILNAGMHAPSGKNLQNWRFIVVEGKKRDEYLKYSQKSWMGLKDSLQKKLKPSLYEFTERFFFTLGGAPAIIFCYSMSYADERHYTSIGSVYMAAQNILLAAQFEGLGTCTMGAPLEIAKEVDHFLGVDKWPEYPSGKLELLCAIVVGFPDHEPPKPPRQLEGRVTWLK